MDEQDNFFDGLDEDVIISDLRRERAGRGITLRMVLTRLGEFVPRDINDFDFEWLHEQRPDFPVYLDFRNLKSMRKAPFKKLLTKLFALDVWSAFKDCRDCKPDDLDHCGLIFPIKGNGRWILHDYDALPTRSKTVRIVHQRTDETFVVERYDAFLDAAVWLINGS